MKHYGILLALAFSVIPMVPVVGSAAKAERPLANADQTMWKYAQCIIRRSKSDAASVFSELPQSESANKALEAMQRPKCLPHRVGELRFDHTIIRGAIAEHLYKNRDKGSLPESIYDSEADIRFGSFDQRYDFVFIRAFECALMDNISLAEAIFATEVGSPEESVAMARIAPLLGPCLDDGVEINLTTAMFRSYTAESALRMAVAKKNEVQPKGKSDA